MGRRKAPSTTDRTRAGALLRKRLFAHAWLTNGHNGVQAARQAGYQGKDSTLQVRASQLLKDPMVQAILQEKAEAVENGMGAEEVMELLTMVARRVRTVDQEERPDAFDFITFLGPDGTPAPESAEEPMVAKDLEDAKRQVRERGEGKDDQRRVVTAPPGFAIDLPKAKALGKGRFIKEVTHDAETGAPKIKLGGDRVEILRVGVRALEVIARCKGMMRDAPAPPPKVDLTAAEAPRPDAARCASRLERGLQGGAGPCEGRCGAEADRSMIFYYDVADHGTRSVQNGETGLYGE